MAIIADYEILYYSDITFVQGWDGNKRQSNGEGTFSRDKILLNLFSATRENTPAPKGIWETHYISAQAHLLLLNLKKKRTALKCTYK